MNNYKKIAKIQKSLEELIAYPLLATPPYISGQVQNMFERLYLNLNLECALKKENQLIFQKTFSRIVSGHYH